jgi:putative glutamine amidotransferase
MMKQNNRPIIAINHCIPHEEGFLIPRAYLDAIRGAGGVPIVLPLLADRDYARHAMEAADGVLLPGSKTDVDPRHYRATRKPWCGERSRERDRSDFLLLEKAFQRKVPVLGICYGQQSLNVFCGGSLYQDLGRELGNGVRHRQKPPYARHSHTVSVDVDSRIYRIFRKRIVRVNSIHHQGVRELGRGLRATAWAPDGLIESYEAERNGHFVLGVQWHPERMWRKSAPQQALFRDFVEAARLWRARNR